MTPRASSHAERGVVLCSAEHFMYAGAATSSFGVQRWVVSARPFARSASGARAVKSRVLNSAALASTPVTVRHTARQSSSADLSESGLLLLLRPNPPRGRELTQGMPAAAALAA